MFDSIEHPDITSACRTGYHRPEAPEVYCDYCGEQWYDYGDNAEPDDIKYERGKWICSECREAEEEIWNST